MHALNMNVAACVRASSVPRARRKRREEREREGQHEYSTAPRDASSVSREEKRVQKRLVADDDAMIASFSKLSASSKERRDERAHQHRERRDRFVDGFLFHAIGRGGVAIPGGAVCRGHHIYHTVRRQSRFFICRVFVLSKQEFKKSVSKV